MSSNLKDIAKKLNMSVSTVSRVVNNKTYVKPETRELVMKALNELNYTPNQVARSLKNKSTKTIGVMVPDISEDFFAYVIKGIDEVLSRQGYTMILCDTGEKPDKEELYMDILFEKQIDGIILATVSKEHKTLQKLIAKNLPVIFIDNLPGIKSNYDSVIIDNNKASYIAVEHLIKMGHKTIGAIIGKMDETTGYERLLGYRKALEDYKIDIDENLIKLGDFKEKSGYENMKALLEYERKITAVYVASSKMTYGAIKAIKGKGLKIPGDISLVGFDIHDVSGLISPSITTIIQPEERIGKVAGELMLKRLQNSEERYSQKIVLDPDILIRESCGYTSRKNHNLQVTVRK
jgi:Transcriptional regulators